MNDDNTENGQNDAQNQLAINHQDYVNIRCTILPIICLLITCFVISINYILFVKKGLFNNKQWPTISETARYYPMNKIFAVGLSVLGILFLFLGLIVVAMLQLSGVQWIKYTVFLPILCCAFLILMSNCGLNDQPFVHGTFAILGFFLILIFLLITHQAFAAAGNVQCKLFKTVVLSISTLSVIILSILTPIKETDLVCCAKAMDEYVLVISLFIYISTWVLEIRKFAFRFTLSHD